MKKLTSIRFDSNSEAVEWINEHNIPREDVVNIQSRFMGCTARAYLDEELYKKARKHNKMIDKEDAKMHIWSYIAVGIMILAGLVLWLWRAL